MRDPVLPAAKSIVGWRQGKQVEHRPPAARPVPATDRNRSCSRGPVLRLEVAS